jgi:hypothetical protein
MASITLYDVLIRLATSIVSKRRMVKNFFQNLKVLLLCKYFHLVITTLNNDKPMSPVHILDIKHICVPLLCFKALCLLICKHISRKSNLRKAFSYFKKSKKIHVIVYMFFAIMDWYCSIIRHMTKALTKCSIAFFAYYDFIICGLLVLFAMCKFFLFYFATFYF